MSSFDTEWEKSYIFSLIKILDAEMCSDIGISDAGFSIAYAELSHDEEITELLDLAKGTDGRWYFPKWFPGIENSLRCDAGSRHEFWKECFDKAENEGIL